MQIRDLASINPIDRFDNLNSPSLSKDLAVAARTHQPGTLDGMGRPLRFLTAAIALLLAPSAQSDDSAQCAASLHALRQLAGEPTFPLRWEETTMDDGHPMVVSIIERNGALMLTLVKSGENLWAEGAGVICRRGADLEARLSKDQLRLGPAANWLTRLALADGCAITLRRGSKHLRIATRGWSGLFVPLVGD